MKNNTFIVRSKIKDAPVFHVINTILLVVISIVCVLPFLNVLATALSTAGNQINFWPKGFTWGNFISVFTNGGLYRMLYQVL